MKTKYIVKVIFLVMMGGISFLSCTKEPYSIPKDVLAVLDMAGSNQEELLKVLDHYNSKDDSLKFDAACYLIANMPMHEAVYLKNPVRLNHVFKHIGEVDSLNKARWDSMGVFLANIKQSELGLKKDIHCISSEFLIENIDCAFFAWDSFPWCKNLTAEEFKTYVLPYRSSNEPIIHYRRKFMEQFSWLKDSMGDNSDYKLAFAYIYNNCISWFSHTTNIQYPIPMDYDQLMLAKRGSCDDECNLLSAILRSMGVLNVIDHVSYWANRSGGHSWVATLDSIGNPLIIDKNNKYPEHKDYIHSGYFKLNPPSDSLLPEQFNVTTNKTAGKVVRKTFVKTTSNKGQNLNDFGQDPLKVNNPFHLDVTKDYLTTANINLEIEKSRHQEVVYLCLFDREAFLPIACSYESQKSHSFKDVGVGVLYIACTENKGKLTPVSDPFIVHDNDSIQFLPSKVSQKTQLTLYRKYPLFGNILNYANTMVGGQFQVSNDKGFRDRKDVYTISKTPIVPTTINVDIQNRYRYLRYYGVNNNSSDVAEVYYYENNRRLVGEIFVETSEFDARKARRIFDNNFETYCYTSSSYIGVDLGEDGLSGLSKIIFCPRTDTNFILKGNTYTLLFWDDGWKKFSSQTALDYSITFNDVPSGTLYWLHCENGGKEERPFSYENGKQVWW